MTVAYNANVATSRGLGNFVLLLFWWRGSIYKLVYPHLILYLSIYFLISILYRYYFSYYPDMKSSFEELMKYCKDYGGLIPLSFVLGFYVSQIVTRWWSQWMICPWPDNLAILVATHLQGTGERSRLMRRTVMRYINLSFVMTMTMMSPQAQARFPTLDHFVEAGFLLQHEKLIIEHLNEKSAYSKYWIPLVWAGSIVVRARREGRIADDMALAIIVKALCKFRGGCGDLLGFDWVNIPLVYNQVASLAVYLYFCSSLLGQQFTTGDPTNLDLYFPIFLFLEFFFYMGWLKVAETMLNAWGEDDDDFEVNWMIDRNFCVSYIIVDEMHTDYPEMLKDQYFDEVIPEDLPYTAAAAKYKNPKSMRGSTYYKKVEKSMFVKRDPDKISGQTKMSNMPSEKGSRSRAGSTAIVVEAGPVSDANVTSETPGIEITYKHYMDSSFVPLDQEGSYSVPETSTYPTSAFKSPAPSKNISETKQPKSGNVDKKDDSGDKAK